MEKKLIRLESRLQSLIEGSAARLFAINKTDLTQQLTRALKDSLVAGKQNEFLAPDVFTLEVSETQAMNWSNNPGFLTNLAQTLQTAAAEEGIRFNKRPEIRIQSNSQLAPGEIKIITKSNVEIIPQTTAMEVESDNEENVPKNTYLIVDGVNIIQLTRAAVNIGRRADNQVVVNDQRVSRLHAQLRVVNGSYVIFDLDSKGGTFVNGNRIHQYTLKSGDVISLSGVPIVFGQDTPEEGETRNYQLDNPGISP